MSRPVVVLAGTMLLALWTRITAFPKVFVGAEVSRKEVTRRTT